MPKKTKLKSPENSNVVAFGNNSNVITNLDYSIKLDLNPFIDGLFEKHSKGDNKFVGYVGQPKFIEEIREPLNRYVRAVKNTQLSTFIHSLMKFLSDHYADVYGSNFSVKDLSQALINEHSNYLKREYKISASTLRTLYHSSGNGLLKEIAAEYSQLENLKGANFKVIKYPEIKVSKQKRTKKTSSFAAEYVYQQALQYLTNLDKNWYSQFNAENVTDGSSPNMHKHMVHEIMWRKLNGEKFGNLAKKDLKFWEREFGLDRRPFDPSQRLLGSKMQYPELEKHMFVHYAEAAASAIVVSYETGWLDTLRLINLKENWYTTDATDLDNIRASDSVTIFARRPKTEKTGERPKSQISSGKYGSAFWAINRLYNKSKPLREFAERMLKINTLDAATRTYLEKATRSPFAFVTTNHPAEIKHEFGRSTIAQFLREFIDVRELDEEQKEEVTNFNWSHMRIIAADREYHETNGDIFAVQKKLGHKSERTTSRYLDTHHLKSELYGVFSKVTGIVYDELSQGFNINANVLRARYVKEDDLTDQERSELSGMTASGARCKSIDNPPSEIGNLGKGHCQAQSCILCPHAIFIPQEKRALKTFAKRHADLQHKANTLPPSRFFNSMLEAEIKGLETYKDIFFGNRLEEYETIYSDRLSRLADMMEVA